VEVVINDEVLRRATGRILVLTRVYRVLSEASVGLVAEDEVVENKVDGNSQNSLISFAFVAFVL